MIFPQPADLGLLWMQECAPRPHEIPVPKHVVLIMTQIGYDTPGRQPANEEGYKGKYA
jgi:hypothetical protein